MVTRVGRGETLMNTNTVTPGTEAWTVQASGGWLCTMYWVGPHCLQGDPGDNKSSTLAKRGPGCLLPPRPPCCVPRKEPRSCWQHLWVLLVPWQYPAGFSDTVVKRRWGFSTIWDSLAMPSSLGPSMSNDGSSWPPPSTLRKAAWEF